MKIRRIIDYILEIFCVTLFVFITIIGAYQIITRYVFNAPSTVSEELLTYAFTWLALVASALVFGKRDHMRMSFVTDTFSDRAALFTAVLAEVLVLIFAAVVFVFGGIAITRLTMSQLTASLGIHMGYIYVILPVCGIITIIYSILNIIDIVRGDFR